MANNTPEFRFPGYVDNWRQQKLGEVFIQTSEYVNPKVKNLELWSLTVENGLTPKTERYNRDFLVKKEDQFKSVSNNEFIYNPMNITLGAVDLNKTGKQVAVSGYYTTMRAAESYDSDFWDIWLKSPLAIKMYKRFATGSLIERQRVQFPTLSQLTVSVPSKDEQVCIGNLFKILADSIDLLQQELTALKQTKQGFLQKMFPKEGESVPEIRFPGFYDEWQKVNLNDLGTIKSGIGFPDSEQGGQEGIPFYKVSDMNNIENKKVIIRSNNYVTDEQISKRKWNINNDVPAVIFAKVGAALLLDRKRLINHPFLIDNNLMAFSFSNSIDTQFGFTLFTTLKLPKYAQVGALPSFNASDIRKIIVSVPSNKEQGLIGKFFDKLDAEITLKEQELQALQQTKKAFLQKMFV